MGHANASRGRVPREVVLGLGGGGGAEGGGGGGRGGKRWEGTTNVRRPQVSTRPKTSVRNIMRLVTSGLPYSGFSVDSELLSAAIFFKKNGD